jgi:hypothetical protein
LETQPFAFENPVNLSQCDGKRVAVVLALQGKAKVLRGLASYSHHEILGNALRIAIQTQPDAMAIPEILLAEDSWRGEISAGALYDCDLCIRLY